MSEVVCLKDMQIGGHSDELVRSIRNSFPEIVPMILTGTTGIDNLLGGVGDDSLSGLAGDDILKGGLGRDYLDGGSGADTYLFQRGDGQDTLEDSSSDSSVDKLVFSGTGLTSTNVVVTRVGDSSDLLISFGGGITDSILLKGQIYGGFSSNYGIESITFSDGVIWTEAQLWNAYLTAGASSNDTLTGTAANETLRGGLGRDYLEGKGGADTYLFQRGDGQDRIYDPSNNLDISIDRLVFSGTGLTAANAIVTRVNADNDLRISFKGLSDSVTLAFQAGQYVQPLDGVDSVTFSDGVVWNKEQLQGSFLATGASTNDTLYGTTASNTLRGGRGRDYLDGRGGSDTYLFQLGDGQDTIQDWPATGSSDPGFDRLVFSGVGLTAANAVITRIPFGYGYSTLKISFKGLSDSVVLADPIPDSPTFSADGTALYSRIFDVLNTIGIETVTFGDGIVWTKAQLWNASIAQTDLVLSGTAVNDTLSGGVGDDRLNGLAGNDTLRGNRGDDDLRGGEGADTYLFQLGDGGDTIYDGGVEGDTLIFSGTGLTSTNAIVTRLGDSSDLQIGFRGLSDSVVLKDQVYPYSGSYGVDSVKFSNGVTWTEAQLWNAYLTQGAESDDKLVGKDTNNTLRGGLGNDYLDGGLGADAYLFSLGDGGDILADTGYDSAIDSLVFSGTGLTSTNVSVTRLGTSNDLQISFGTGLSDSIVLKDQLYGGIVGNYGVETIKFSNGVTWNESQLWAAIR
jgi:Ca2+-binding RTX toxin-like protein